MRWGLLVALVACASPTPGLAPQGSGTKEPGDNATVSGSSVAVATDAGTPVATVPVSVLVSRAKLDAWLASRDTELAFALPRFHTATCPGRTLAAADAAPGHGRDGDLYLYSGFFETVLLDGLGFDFAGVDSEVPITKHPLILHGTVRKGGEAFALTWSKDVLTKVQQFPYPAAHSYRQDLASELIRLPGSSEAVVIRVRAGTPRLVRDVFWIDGAPVASLPISRELLAAGTATVPRQTMALQACTFSDTAGHAFEGHARRPETIEAADQVRAEMRGDHEVELVRVTINRGAGCPNLDGVVTGIERLAVDVVRMTADARTHFDRRVAREGTSIRDQLYKLRRTLPRTSSRRDQGPMPLVSEAMYRWNAATQQLRITMLHKRGAWGYYIYESVEVATKGIPVHKEKPRPDEMVLDYAIELATEYEYDRAGTLLHERDHPVRALHEQLRAFGAPKTTHLEWDYP